MSYWHSLSSFFDDPYGIRTRVTAVKGRCLNHLTNGPYLIGSGGGDRTPDLTGMNRTLSPAELHRQKRKNRQDI